jgi:SRSO17 transposase
VHGLLLELPRKSIEPMVLALDGARPQAVRAMQLCLSEGAWEGEAILQRHWPEVNQPLGTDESVLTLDGRDFLKQGQESVGGKR